MNAYVNDLRVVKHPDGSWLVSDGATEYMVVEHSHGVVEAFEADGYPIPHLCGRNTFDDVVRALIGDPR